MISMILITVATLLAIVALFKIRDPDTAGVTVIHMCIAIYAVESVRMMV